MKRLLKFKFLMIASALVALLVMIDFVEGPRIARLAGFSSSLSSVGDSAVGKPRILFIGNSLTGYHDMPGEFAALAGFSGHHPYVEKHLNYGKDLKFQLAQKDIVSALKKEKWDFVVLQEYSNYPLVKAQEFSDDVMAFVPLIHASGAKVVLFENWPYKGAAADTVAKLNASYAKVAALAGGEVVPLAVAQDWIVHNSSINMYMDEKHPTAIATYMGASEFMKYFFKVAAKDNLPGGAKLPNVFELEKVSAADMQTIQKAVDL